MSLQTKPSQVHYVLNHYLLVTGNRPERRRFIRTLRKIAKKDANAVGEVRHEKGCCDIESWQETVKKLKGKENTRNDKK